MSNNRPVLWMVSVSMLLAYTFFTSLSVLLFSARPLAVPKDVFGAGTVIRTVVLYLFTLAALTAAGYMVWQRDAYLPFLGPAAFPVSVLREGPVPRAAPVAEYRVKVAARNGACVLYWAAKPGHDGLPARPAYEDTRNAGVARAWNGVATFVLECPSSYTVNGRTLARHVHYRVHDGRVFGPVRTARVVCPRATAAPPLPRPTQGPTHSPVPTRM